MEPKEKDEASGVEERGVSASCSVGPIKAEADSTARAAASSTAVPCSAARVHHTKPIRAAHAWRRAAGVRTMVAGSGRAPIGAVNRRAPRLYSPTMKA